MKISLLDKQNYLAEPSETYNSQKSAENSYFIVNFAKDEVDEVITKRATLAELGKLLIDELSLVQYGSNNSLNTLNAGETAYASTNIGQYITAADRSVLDEALTDVAYDTTNKKLTSTTRGGDTPTDIVTVNTLLTDMDLNITQVTNTAGKTIATIDEASGKVSATFQDISILSSQVSDKSDAINSSGATLATSKAVKDALESLDITQITNTAGKTVATIDEADGKVSATFQDISILSSQVSDKSDAINSSSATLATSKAVKDALESLDITQITNTAGKTVATIDEADGKVSATFQDISILSSQISDKGTANCVATLDANGHVPSSQLPSYVDDVIEGTISTFPATGETGKIYVDTATNTSYRWSGSQYVKVASDLSLGETSSTAYRGDYGAAAYAHGVTNKGSAFASGLYKITTNSEGHVTAATAAVEADIMALHTAHTAQTSGLYKITVDGTGHVSSVTAVEKADITGLDIPGQDTTYSTGTSLTSGLTKLYTSYGSGTDGAITQNAFTVLMANMITNFGLTVALPSAASITEDDTEGTLTATLSGLDDNCTIVIQKQDTGDTWTTYTEGDAWEIGDIFRVYVTRTITVGGSTFTNSGVIGSTHTTTTSYTPTSPEEPEENP